MAEKKKRTRLEKDQERTRERYAKQEQQRQRSRYLDENSPEEEAQIQRLQSQILDIETDLSQFARDGRAWLDIKNDESRTDEQRMMGEIMQRRMLYACATQLRGGLTPSKILTAVGMYAGMSALSPAFREMTAKMKATALGKAVDYAAAHPDSKVLGANGRLTERLAEKRDAYLAAANGGRMPFTPETAAVASIRMSREAYTMMRDGKHEPSDVMDMYRDAMAVLSETAEADGVRPEDIAQSQRTILGKMAERDPSLKQMFHEMAYGTWQKEDPKTVRDFVYDEDGKPHHVERTVWTGDFVYEDKQNGETISTNGSTDMFTVRKPMSDIEYAKSVADAIDVHDSGFDLTDTHDLDMARNDMAAALEAASGYKTGCPYPDDASVRMAFDQLKGSVSQTKSMAYADWKNDKSGGNPVERMDRADMLAANAALVGEASVLLYSDSYSDNASMFDAIDGQHAADISSLAMAFAERTAGLDVKSKEFIRETSRMSDWYARASVCVDQGFSLDLQDPETQAALDAYLSDDENFKKFDDMRQSMAGTVNFYARALDNMLATGNDFDTSMEMLRYGEEKGAAVWANGYDESSSAALEQTRQWARSVVDNIDLSHIPQAQHGGKHRDAQADAERASRRAREADMKFGGIGNRGRGNDGPQYS